MRQALETSPYVSGFYFHFHFLLSILKLFRISYLGFRIYLLWSYLTAAEDDPFIGGQFTQA